MSKKTDIKNCRYKNCKHGGKVDTSIDDFVVPHKGYYYHKDCWNEYKEITQKDKQIKADLQYIRNQWVSSISNTVVYSDLNRCLNELLVRGVSSDYMVFTIDYVIDHHLSLRYPMGFKYFVDKAYIKKAYQEKLAKKQAKQDTHLDIDNPTDSPSFKISNPKPSGFGSILRGGKK